MSLKRRFVFLLLLPVTGILLIVGSGGLYYVQKYLLDQWTNSAQLKLEKVAHEIQMRLDEKLQLVDLIICLENLPSESNSRDFLIDHLRQKVGVRSVELRLDEPNGQVRQEPSTGGVLTMEPDFQEQVLEIVKTIPGENENASKRLIVKVDLSTFLAQIQSMGLWKGSSACLVTTGGYYLAHTDHSMHDTIALGESGDPLEKSVLKAMKNLGYGTLFGTGYPPDLVISFYQVPSTEWYVVIFSKGGIILEPIIRFAVYSVLGIIGFVGAIFLMIRSTTGSVARSVEHLSSLAARVAGGDYSERLPARQSDEIGHLNGRVNEMMEALKQRDLIQSTFGRYIDPEIAAELLNNPESLYMGGEEKVVTIMMADLIGFEEMADKTQPEEVIAILNEYLSAMIEVISFYKGIIIDFFGAGILVFFNGITANPKERAADAVKCALEMRNRFQTLRGRDGARQLQMLGIVTGIHTGAVIVGNIGAETRTKYGIVGSAVNLTQRIKSSGATGTILISEETYQMLGQRVSVGGRTSAQLKGVEHPKTIYMVESIDNQS